MTIVRSGKCVPPANGSLSTTMSPGPSAKALRAAATDAGIDAEMHGHVIAHREYPPSAS